MSRAVWWCLLTLVSCCRGSTVGNVTTCEEFGGSFHPQEPLSYVSQSQQLIGNWTTVYAWMFHVDNSTETISISEMTASELQEHHNFLKAYPDSALKLKVNIHDEWKADGVTTNVLNVMIPTDSFGSADVWSMNATIDLVALTSSEHVYKYTIKWQKVDGFLIVMFCEDKKAIVLADTGTPDEAKLQKVVADAHFGFAGTRI